MNSPKQGRYIIRIPVLFSIGISIALSCLYVFVSSEETYHDSETWLTIVGWVSNILLVSIVYYVYKIKKNWFDFNIIFSVILFMFCNGSVLLYSFGIKNIYLFRVASIDEILHAALFFLVGFSWYIVGVLSVVTKCNNGRIHFMPSNTNEYDNAIKVTGYLSLMISTLPFISNYFNTLMQSITYGYGSLFSNSNSVTNGLSAYLSKYFIPSIILLIYTYRNNNKVAHSVYVIILISLGFGYLISGNRGTGVTILLTYLVYYYNFEHKFNGKEFRKIFIPVLALLILIPAIFSFRQITERNANDLMGIMGKILFSEEDNFIVKTISELGGSMYPYILTRRIIPSTYSFRLGESYLASILMLIPSFLMGGYSFASKAALDTWLQRTLHLYAGAGYSLFAEAYYNFGDIAGSFSCLFLGLFFSRLLTQKDNNDDYNTMINLLKTIFLYLSMTVARYPFHGTLRNAVYICGIFLLVIKMIHKNRGQNTAIPLGSRENEQH